MWKQTFKAYTILKESTFVQSYLFPHSGLEGHAFHWHAVLLLSKSRKQRFGSLLWIPKTILTFPRNAFSYWGILRHVFLYFEKHSEDASPKKKTGPQSYSCSPQPYKYAGRGKGKWTTRDKAENICPLRFPHSSIYISLVLASSHTLHLITLQFQ